ncbi:nlaIVM [Symbiodinium natans]|uniref:NlaIVM protein n=1 Tax=Symbiodinium natans TaxID=878477 RepID=A0A812NWK6_9DINO|nr:nlaIVM [Symbiodinium natans]
MEDASSVTTFEACRSAIQLFLPAWFLLENVDIDSGTEKDNESKSNSNLTLILQALTALGYTVRTFLLNSQDYGVPQRRVRLYFVGYRTADYMLPDDSESVKAELERRADMRAKKDEQKTREASKEKDGGDDDGIDDVKDKSKWQALHMSIAESRFLAQSF